MKDNKQKNGLECIKKKELGAVLSCHIQTSTKKKQMEKYCTFFFGQMP